LSSTPVHPLLRWIFNRNVYRPLATSILVVAVVMGLTACGSESPSDPSDKTASSSRPLVADSMTIPRMLATDARFSTLQAALDSTGLDSVLASDGPFTLFAPPNDAFSTLPRGTLDTLLSGDRRGLRRLLTRHIVDGRLTVEGRSESHRVLTMSGDTVVLRSAPHGLMPDDAAILDGDIEAANGLLHVVDAVLRSPDPEGPEAPGS